MTTAKSGIKLTQSIAQSFARLSPDEFWLTAKLLSTYSATNTVLSQTINPTLTTKPYSEPPTGMVTISGGTFQFNVGGTEMEGSTEPGVDFQYPWELQPSYTQSHSMTINTFYLDKTEVTNLQYQAFMNAAHYRPVDTHNFLLDWTGRILRNPITNQAGTTNR